VRLKALNQMIEFVTRQVGQCPCDMKNLRHARLDTRAAAMTTPGLTSNPHSLPNRFLHDMTNAPLKIGHEPNDGRPAWMDLQVTFGYSPYVFD
jgi:hypothetical protein